MPHSSGGGSHGGGSHGGSYHGSHGGNERSTGAMSHYQPGCRTFVHYHRHRPHFYYTYGDFGSMRRNALSGLISLLILLPIAAMLVWSVICEAMPPEKLSGTEEYTILIEDSNGMLGDTAELESSLAAFKEKTGITPAVIAEYSSEWSGSAETEAYSLYLNKLPDETCWLIFYSYAPDDMKNSWVWEGMQGDDTDGILTEYVTSQFNDNLTDYFYAYSKYTPAQAIAKAFDELTPTVMNAHIDWSSTVMCSLLVLFILIISVIVTVNAVKWMHYKDEDFTELKGNTGEGKTVYCKYCGGEMASGEERCPHCGAQIL